MRNPVKKLKEKQGWTIQEIAAAADIGFSTAYQNYQGSARSMNGNLAALFERLGYDPDKVREEYQKYRKVKQEELISQAG